MAPLEYGSRVINGPKHASGASNSGDSSVDSADGCEGRSLDSRKRVSEVHESQKSSWACPKLLRVSLGLITLTLCALNLLFSSSRVALMPFRPPEVCAKSKPQLPEDARVLVTGAAGFIGMHVSLALATHVQKVIAVDSFTNYYSLDYKAARVSQFAKIDVISFVNMTICDRQQLSALFDQYQITHVIHLAAQAGVRYSQKNPQSYVTENIQCFVELLELLRKRPTIPLAYASSSSVYGLSTRIPFREDDPIDMPANLYGASKKHDEDLAFSYHHLYGIRSVGLRFFTVYGPWGRPDMAAYLFLNKVENNLPITIYNDGQMWRDMTFVNDIVDGIIASVAFIGSPSDPQTRGGRPPVLNLGNDQPVSVKHLIEVIEKTTGKTATRKDGGPSRGEIERTHADVERARCWLQYRPKTSVEEGIRATHEWYKTFHRPVFLTGRFTEKVDLA